MAKSKITKINMNFHLRRTYQKVSRQHIVSTASTNSLRTLFKPPHLLHELHGSSVRPLLAEQDPRS